MRGATDGALRAAFGCAELASAAGASADDEAPFGRLEGDTNRGGAAEEARAARGGAGATGGDGMNGGAGGGVKEDG